MQVLYFNNNRNNTPFIKNIDLEENSQCLVNRTIVDIYNYGKEEVTITLFLETGLYDFSVSLSPVTLKDALKTLGISFAAIKELVESLRNNANKTHESVYTDICVY